ncbi:hypothetical protein [Micromonospora maris]|nr:hypothetical protein OG712_14610 [Micromonospora maris]
MTVKALIFDFDALLMDTETTLLESWRGEWRRHGLKRFALSRQGVST